MKKILALILVLMLCFSLASCDEKEEFNGSPDDIPNAPLNSARL